MFCSKCGNKVAEDDAFCGECGAKVDVKTSFDNTCKNAIANQQDTSVGNLNDNLEKDSNIWRPVVLAGIGAFIGLVLSGLVGLVLSLIGLKMASKQKKQGENNQAPFAWTCVLAVVSVIFWIMSMSA